MVGKEADEGTGAPVKQCIKRTCHDNREGIVHEMRRVRRTYALKALRYRFTRFSLFLFFFYRLIRTSCPDSNAIPPLGGTAR